MLVCIPGDIFITGPLASAAASQVPQVNNHTRIWSQRSQEKGSRLIMKRAVWHLSTRGRSSWSPNHLLGPAEMFGYRNASNCVAFNKVQIFCLPATLCLAQVVCHRRSAFRPARTSINVFHSWANAHARIAVWSAHFCVIYFRGRGHCVLLKNCFSSARFFTGASRDSAFIHLSIKEPWNCWYTEYKHFLKWIPLLKMFI